MNSIVWEIGLVVFILSTPETNTSRIGIIPFIKHDSELYE